jgi:hypothetical protein
MDVPNENGRKNHLLKKVSKLMPNFVNSVEKLSSFAQRA